MNISAFSTKAVTKDGPKYNNRLAVNIDSAVHYVMNGNKKEHPFYSSSTGFPEGKPDKIAAEIKKVQELYRKETGIRIRGEVVEIRKDELNSKEKKEHIKAVADSYSAHFLYKGFQTAYGVFDKGDRYSIVYAINPVSFGDGSKYRHNNTDIHDEQVECLNNIIGRNNNPDGIREYDYSGYEYY